MRETETEGGKNKGGEGEREHVEEEEEEEGKKKGLENMLHYSSLLLQLCYLHSNNGGLASAEQVLINKGSGERAGSQGEEVGGWRWRLRHGPI